MILKRLFVSSIGRKAVVALTGTLLIFFIIGHLLGNFNMFFGQEAMNSYAAFLKSLPGPLWTARIGLFVVFFLHVIFALKLKIENNKARPQKYVKGNTATASIASRTMAQSGMLILAFVIYHILHFTAGIVDPSSFSITDPQGRHDVYSMVIIGFQNPLIAASYIVAMIFLALHLSHAVQSIFQSFGLANDNNRPMLQKISNGFAALIFLGYASIPASVLSGLIRLPGQ